MLDDFAHTVVRADTFTGHNILFKYLMVKIKGLNSPAS